MDILGQAVPLGWKDKDCSTTAPTRSLRSLRGRGEATAWGSRPSHPPCPTQDGLWGAWVTLAHPDLSQSPRSCHHPTDSRAAFPGQDMPGEEAQRALQGAGGAWKPREIFLRLLSLPPLTVPADMLMSYATTVWTQPCALCSGVPLLEQGGGAR